MGQLIKRASRRQKLARLRRRARIPLGWRRAPVFTIAQILDWADRHFDRHGRWPQVLSGPIPGSLGETWHRVDGALRKGLRGMEGGSSLAKLLLERRGAPHRWARPLTQRKILQWAEAHRQRTGKWPGVDSGVIRESPPDTWRRVDGALRRGHRGLPAGSSLARLLTKRRAVRNRLALPTLSVERILNWADAYRARTGRWPTVNSGPVPGSGGETWAAIWAALRRGGRGLGAPRRFPVLLAEERGKPPPPSPLTLEQVLAWADQHFQRTGKWPTFRSGPVLDAPGEKWPNIYNALRHGYRGLPAGRGLTETLVQARGAWSRLASPPFNRTEVLSWADRHYQRTGRWPTRYSGPIPEAPGLTWSAVTHRLRRGGRRGLAGVKSLADLLNQERRAVSLPPKPPT